MPVPFGLSIGDFIAFIEATVTVINSLKDSTGAGKEYRDVIRELDSLKLALAHVQNVETNEPELRAALESVASNCGRTIQDFLNKIQKFDVALASSGSSRNKIKSGLRKIQWALYSKEDVRTFQIQLHSHTASLNILLSGVNRIAVTAAREEQYETLKTHSQALIRIESKIDRESVRATAMQMAILSTIARCWTEFQSLVAYILFSNLKIFNFVASCPQMPTQVLLEKPVIFEDAHGRILPLQMTWVDTWDHFETMLKWKFSDVPGLLNVEEGLYVLADTFSKKEIYKDSPIRTVFRPGRSINMSMIFHMSLDAQHCPKCKSVVVESGSIDNHCEYCGLSYIRHKEPRKILGPYSATDEYFPFNETEWPGPMMQPKKERNSLKLDFVPAFSRVKIYCESSDEEKYSGDSDIDGSDSGENDDTLLKEKMACRQGSSFLEDDQDRGRISREQSNLMHRQYEPRVSLEIDAERFSSNGLGTKVPRGGAGWKCPKCMDLMLADTGTYLWCSNCLRLIIVDQATGNTLDHRIYFTKGDYLRARQDRLSKYSRLPLGGFAESVEEYLNPVRQELSASGDAKTDLINDVATISKHLRSLEASWQDQWN